MSVEKNPSNLSERCDFKLIVLDRNVFPKLLFLKDMFICHIGY